MATMNPSIPLEPPREWFTPPPTMAKDAGCVVEPNGRIYGYLCHWGSILFDGTNDRWTPPKSRNSYAYAHTGDTICDDGSTIKTANLGGDAGHAPADQRDELSKLQDFYENTQTQLARVRYGEDENGVWFSGACWPTVTDLDMAKLRASARSGHWAVVGQWGDPRTGKPGYELVGACLVNVPGLKYARADKCAAGVLTLRPMQMEAGADHDGAMVALYLDATTAAQLAVDGGEPAEDLHITLAYFDDAAADRDDWDELHDHVAAATKRHLPLSGKIGGQGVFFAEDGGVVHWACPDVPGLNALREEVVARAELMGFEVRKDHGFNPHVTLLYDSDGSADAPAVDVHDITFDRLTLAVGGDMTELTTNPVSYHVAAGGTVEMEAAPVAVEIPVHGVLVIEGLVTEDGRLIQEGAIDWRECPLPLYAKLENTGGHTDAQLVGRIDEIWRDETDSKIVHYSGMIAPDAASEYGQRVLDAIGAKMLKGVSIDGIAGLDDAFVDGDEVLVFTKMIIGGATLTPMPAIGGATVTISGGTDDASEGDLTVKPNTELAVADGDDTVEDTDSVESAVEDVQADDTADADKWDAVNEKLAAISDRLEHAISLLESVDMTTRVEAATRRLVAG